MVHPKRGLTLAQAAEHLGTVAARISELERGTRLNLALATAYREWLDTQQTLKLAA